MRKNKRGGLEFTFQKIDTGLDVCEQCSYGPDVCCSLPNPRNREGGDFINFCANVGGDYHIPEDGSLEETYKNYPKFLEYIKNGKKEQEKGT